MSAPKCFLRRREVIAVLMDLGFARKIVQKWLREGILPPHEFPGLPKRANQRAYWSLSSVEQRLGVTLRNAEFGMRNSESSKPGGATTNHTNTKPAAADPSS